MWCFDEVALWEHLDRRYLSRRKVSFFSFYDERFADVAPHRADRFLLYHGVASWARQHFRYEDGRLLRVAGGRRIDTIYAHFQKRAMEVRFSTEFWPADPLRFAIRPNYFARL